MLLNAPASAHMQCNRVFAQSIGDTLQRGLAITMSEDAIAPDVNSAAVDHALGLMREACSSADSGRKAVSDGHDAWQRLASWRVLNSEPFLRPDLEDTWLEANVAAEVRLFFAPSTTATTNRHLAKHSTVANFVTDVLPVVRVSEATAVAAMVYVSRAAARGLPFTPTSAARIYIAALVLAAKMNEDIPMRLQFYAREAGFAPALVSSLEVVLLNVISYETYVSPTEYLMMLFSVRQMHFQARHREANRDWLTVAKCVGVPLEMHLQVNRRTRPAPAAADKLSSDGDSPTKGEHLSSPVSATSGAFPLSATPGVTVVSELSEHRQLACSELLT